APNRGVHTIYVNADTIKTLDYPDVLIRLLLAAFEGLPSQGRWARIRRRLSRKPSQPDTIIAELRELLALPVSSKLKLTTARGARSRKQSRVVLRKGPLEGGLEAEGSQHESREETRETDERKIRTVDARL